MILLVGRKLSTERPLETAKMDTLQIFFFVQQWCHSIKGGIHYLMYPLFILLLLHCFCEYWHEICGIKRVPFLAFPWVTGGG